MYVFQYHPGEFRPHMLHELDKKGWRLAKLAYPNHRFEVVSGRVAHGWVRNGRPHSTPLYISSTVGGKGRIRYSKDFAR